jgi:hypothetical protein
MSPVVPSSPASATDLSGVTFLIPVYNGARWLDDVLAAIRAQGAGISFEIVAVDDGSTDGSRALLVRHAAAGDLRIIDGPRRGAAAALNAGLRVATHPLIAQVDQDVVIEPGWLAKLIAALDAPGIAAAQGHYVAPRRAGLWSRVMALDLRQRYSALRGNHTDHVCTGNSVYRASALEQVGGFDESLGYGYDNDISYRLTKAGFRLAHVAGATSTHHWRERAIDYARQQYGQGYGRLDLVAKHRHRVAGDTVSRLSMMLHAPLAAVGVAAALVAGVLVAMGLPARVPAIVSAALVGTLVLERFVAGLRAAVRFRDAAGLFFVPAHLLRDLAWVAAIAVWSARRLRGGGGRPSDSMRPREPRPSIPTRPPT